MAKGKMEDAYVPIPLQNERLSFSLTHTDTHTDFEPPKPVIGNEVKEKA